MSSPQLEGRPILCFAHDWGGDPTSKTHIMRILSRRNRVLWIESIGMRRPAATARDLRRVGHKLARALSRCREAEPNLFVASPLVLPFPGWPLADRINATILSVSLRRLCRRLGLERPILWSFMPNVVRLLGSLDESGVVYHCVDEYAAFTGVPRRALLRMEQELARRADLVLTSSETLRDERRALNPNTHFVTHGVDVRHFGKALDEATEIPKDLRDIRRPVVGFFGLLADWVDFNLLREAAGARPDLSFVLLGKEAADLGALRGFRNVHLLGRKQYEELPAYCRGFDVGIIPFRWNALTVRANPLKLREYLAAGLPVVATPLPEVARYRPHVRLAEGPSAFLAAIDAALGEQGSDRARARRGRARRELGKACGRDRDDSRRVGEDAGGARPSRADHAVTVVLFWISALLLAYTYLGYPILIRVWARLRPRPARSRPIEPSLTVVVVAHDEAARIGTRIRNLLASDYPDGRLEILVGSDGSTDGTAERARAYERPGVRVLAFGLRRGKAAVLNDLVPQARGEIVVLTDARQQFEPGTLRALVAPLADPEVGAVGGDLILTRGAADTTVGEGIGAYWRYEKWMRACESRVDSSLGASGAIYAIRRDLFEPLREDTLLDDVLIPLHMVRRGRRVLFEPRARAFDRVASTPGEEFRRKVRTLAGNFQMFAREHWVLDPRRNRLWLQTVSHKGLRLLGPPLLAALFGSNAALAGSPIHRMIFVLQIGFYAAAAAGGLLRRRRRVPQALGLPYAFCLLNAAVVVAAWRFLSGRQCVAWEKSASAGPVRRGESSIGAASACPARWSRGRYMDWRPPPRSWPASRSAHRPGDLCNEGSQSPDSGQG